MGRVHGIAAGAWWAVAVGAGCGFVARDLLQLPPGVVAGAWLAGALGVAVLPLWRRRAGDGERGQATVEWVGLLLLTALALGALGAVVTRGDGWSFAGFLAHRFVCAVAGCDDGDRRLVRAYGERDAGLVRGLAPNLAYEAGERQLPVDWRRCRARRCADGPEARDLDVHRTGAGERATVFTRLLRRGGRTYVQYWLFYPDSNTAVAGSDKLWELAWLLPRLTGLLKRAPPYPGFHRDDWEGYAIRIDPDGSVWARASAHGEWGDWAAATGWVRVERGSHAGRVPAPAGRLRAPASHERTTTAEALRLIPLETLDKSRYRPHSDRIKPPWRKRVFRDPESPES
jgi:hypothetical protein